MPEAVDGAAGQGSHHCARQVHEEDGTQCAGLKRIGRRGKMERDVSEQAHQREQHAETDQERGQQFAVGQMRADGVPWAVLGVLLFTGRVRFFSTEELAQNGVRREIVSDSVGGARRTLCATEELAQNGVRREIVSGLGSVVRAAPFALLRNSRKTERGAIGSWIDSGVRAAPFALLRNSRKTECGAIGSWIDSGVRAAPFALSGGSQMAMTAARARFKLPSTRNTSGQAAWAATNPERMRLENPPSTVPEM